MHDQEDLGFELGFGRQVLCLGWDQSRDPVVFGYKEGQTKATKSPEFTRGIGLPKHRPN